MNVKWKIIYNLIYLCKMYFCENQTRCVNSKLALSFYRKCNKIYFFSYTVDYKQFAHLELHIYRKHKKTCK